MKYFYHLSIILAHNKKRANVVKINPLVTKG